MQLIRFLRAIIALHPRPEVRGFTANEVISCTLLNCNFYGGVKRTLHYYKILIKNLISNCAHFSFILNILRLSVIRRIYTYLYEFD